VFLAFSRFAQITSRAICLQFPFSQACHPHPVASSLSLKTFIGVVRRSSPGALFPSILLVVNSEPPSFSLRVPLEIYRHAHSCPFSRVHLAGALASLLRHPDTPPMPSPRRREHEQALCSPVCPRLVGGRWPVLAYPPKPTSSSRTSFPFFPLDVRSSSPAPKISRWVLGFPLAPYLFPPAPVFFVRTFS